MTRMASWLRFFLALNIFFLLHSQAASAMPWNPFQSCRDWVQERLLQRKLKKLQAQAFQPSDFPESIFWHGVFYFGRPHSPFYSQWAAQLATSVAEEVTRGQLTFEEILDLAARSRMNLEFYLNLTPLQLRNLQAKSPEQIEELVGSAQGHHPGTFGRKRKFGHIYILGRNDESLSAGFKGIRQRANRDMRLIYSIEAQRLKAYFANSSTNYPLGDFDSAEVHNVFYHLLDGEPVFASTIVRFTQGVHKAETIIVHPMPGERDFIMKDVFQRLEILKAKKNSKDRNFLKEEFLKILFGLYICVNYDHGSASIMRSYLAGVYLALFGRKPPIFPDGIDLKAMTALSEEDFLREFSKIFEDF